MHFQKFDEKLYFPVYIVQIIELLLMVTIQV